MSVNGFITGEHKRTIDDRYRLVFPPEFAEAVMDDNGETILTKERYGCLSLWRPQEWRVRFEQRLALIQQKMTAGLMEQQWSKVQQFGRLVSTRNTTIKFANKSRMLVPEGFREFLDVPPNQEVILVGAAICVEIWQPDAWRTALKDQLPLFDGLMQGMLN
jgi:MraZ protein